MIYTTYMQTTISSFKPTASYPERAIVVIFDLEGFSKFFSQPDVQEYVPKFLNLVLNGVSVCYNGGEATWSKKNGKPENFRALAKPIHSKFLGDGALYIFKQDDFKGDDLIYFINRLYTLKNNFDKIIEKASDFVPVLDIPKKIRIGVSAGSVYKLTYSSSNKEEFIGYSINLASRLQAYCRDIGFIVSARISIPLKELQKHSYKKIVATNIKGFPNEIVIIDQADYNGLPEEISNQLFAEV